MLKLPGLIDPHVHLREPGGTHKEIGTAARPPPWRAALPWCWPCPIRSRRSRMPPRWKGLSAARRKARCDYAQFLGAGDSNLEVLPASPPRQPASKCILTRPTARSAWTR